MKYTGRETKIKIQKANLDAEKNDAQPDVLNAEKTAAAAAAKAEGLAAALTHDKVSACDLRSDAGLSSHANAQRTKDYVQEQSRPLTDAKADPVTTSEPWPPGQPAEYEGRPMPSQMQSLDIGCKST